jgi:hypothetical protein
MGAFRVECGESLGEHEMMATDADTSKYQQRSIGTFIPNRRRRHPGFGD